MNPFTALHLPASPDLTDEDVRAAWRAAAAGSASRPPPGTRARVLAASG